MSPAMKKKKDDLGAGLRVSKDNIEAHPAGPPKYGELTQAERAFTLASTFLSGVLAYDNLSHSLPCVGELTMAQHQRIAVSWSAAEVD